MRKRTSSGDDLKRMLVMMLLMQTLLPVLVAPAMRKCGISARLQTSGIPAVSLPMTTATLDFSLTNSDDIKTSLMATVAAALLGTSIPTRDLPGMGATMRTLVARMASA